MKEIAYQNHPENIIYLVTEKEFEKILESWSKDDVHWCLRLEAMLTTKYKYLHTPREDVGYEVFMEINKEEGDQKVFKKNDKHYVLIDMKRKTYIPLSALSKLVSQEEYYEKKMYLN